MILNLTVWLTLPTAEVLKAGELAVKESDAGGALQGQFRYFPAYLTHPKAFSLDPLHLPLVARLFNAHRPYAGVHGVFEDSLPDDWGRKLMVRRYKLGRAEQRIPNLLRLLGGQGLGALSYGEGEKLPQSATGVSSRHLEELVLLAERFDDNPAAMADDELALLFKAGSSPGGARPKALVFDKGRACLAKFAGVRDTFDVVGLEASAMHMARRAGIDTAETRLLTLGTRKCLQVKRFDVTEAGGRNHLLSMQSLLKADGYYYAGYRDLAEVIRRVSTVPKRDLLMLYKQMVFNAMIANTDDHLKNFCMCHDESGWRLSPAFDLMPNIGFNREHVLRIGVNNLPPDRDTLLAEAPYFGIKRRSSAADLVREICLSVSEWPAIFSEHQVPRKDGDVIGNEIKRRLIKTGH